MESRDREKTVAVVMVSYNTAVLTLKSVQKVLESEKIAIHLLVVDNNSQDRTIMQLRRKYQCKNDTAEVGAHRITLLPQTQNLGFGRGNNVAAAYSHEPFLLFLNTDAFVGKHDVAKLVEQMQKNNEVGIVAPMLKNKDGSLQRQGGALPTLFNILRWMWFLDDIPLIGGLAPRYQHSDQDMKRINRRPWKKVGWVGGTALLISRECWQDIGPFDPKIFMYTEDVDLCWRATKKHWEVGILSDVRLTHLGSASSDKKNAIHGEIKGLIYLWQKYFNPTEERMLRWIMRSGLRLRVVIFGILHRYGQQRVYREAMALV